MAKSKSAKEAQRQQEIAAIEHELLLMAMGALGHNRVDPEDGGELFAVFDAEGFSRWLSAIERYWAIPVVARQGTQCLKSAWPRLVFAGRKGQPLDAHNIAARELKPACKMAGIPVIGWHVLRHTAITLIQQAGATGVEAQRFAGHASDAMREKYTHAEVERLRSSVDAVRLVDEQGKERVM